jgi:hypothetical protein
MLLFPVQLLFMPFACVVVKANCIRQLLAPPVLQAAACSVATSSLCVCLLLQV